jgi:type I restriction enzyme, S subunit
MKYLSYSELKPTGDDWLGMVPVHWTVSSLRRHLRVQSGNMIASSEIEDEGYPVFGGNGFRGRYQNWNTEEGTLVIGRYGALCGNVRITDERIWATEHAFRVLPVMDFNARFFAYLLEAIDLNRFSTRSAQPGLNSELVRNNACAIPPPAEQHMIVRFLDQKIARIDSLILKKKRLYELLEEKRLSVVTAAATKGLDKAAPMKPTHLDWAGNIPTHWQILQARFALGKGVYGISDAIQKQGEFGVLRMGDVGYGEISISNLARIDDVDLGLLLEPGDLLFNRTNSYEQVAKVGLFNGDEAQKITFASYLVRFRPTADAEYLKYLLNIPSFLAYVRSHSLRAIGQVNLNPTRYVQLRVFLPPPKEQRAIAEHLREQTAVIEHGKSKIQQVIEALQELRSALIVNAVTGKIDVSSYERAEAAE